MYYTNLLLNRYAKDEPVVMFSGRSDLTEWEDSLPIRAPLVEDNSWLSSSSETWSPASVLAQSSCLIKSKGWWSSCWVSSLRPSFSVFPKKGSSSGSGFSKKHSRSDSRDCSNFRWAWSVSASSAVSSRGRLRLPWEEEGGWFSNWLTDYSSNAHQLLRLVGTLEARNARKCVYLTSRRASWLTGPSYSDLKKWYLDS